MNERLTVLGVSDPLCFPFTLSSSVFFSSALDCCPYVSVLEETGNKSASDIPMGAFSSSGKGSDSFGILEIERKHVSFENDAESTSLLLGS